MQRLPSPSLGESSGLSPLEGIRMRISRSRDSRVFKLQPEVDLSHSLQCDPVQPHYAQFLNIVILELGDKIGKNNVLDAEQWHRMKI